MMQRFADWLYVTMFPHKRGGTETFDPKILALVMVGSLVLGLAAAYVAMLPITNQVQGIRLPPEQ